MSEAVLDRAENLTPSKSKKSLSSFRSRDATVTAKDMYEFLPAAIEVEQTPASPAGRAIIWVIVMLFTVATIWAFFGKIDIVAVAQGKVIPSEYIKHIQPLEAGVIEYIHVKEGLYVNKGEPLITLDTTQTQADLARLMHEVLEREATIERLRAFEWWLASLNQTKESGSDPELSGPLKERGSEPLSETLGQQKLFKQQIAELTARLNTFESEKQKQQAEQAMTQAEIIKKQRVLPVLKERVAAYDILRQKEYGSKLQYLEIKQQLIEEEQDLRIQQARLKQLEASIQSIQNQMATLVSEKRLTNLAQLQETQLQEAGLQQELIKAKERYQQQYLSAPINGQVQQLAVHTIGGVVTAAQVLMVIVPEQSQMEVEAKILNKDIGFVHEGQEAEVKIDTFNFTKYGLIDAEITSISDDAIQDENLGLVYIARFKLKKQQVQVEQRMVNLSPGMSVTAEVKTGKRRLIEYFLSPLLRYKQESLGER